MSQKYRAMSVIAIAAALTAVPSFAQETAVSTPERDSHFDGLYIQGFGGISTQGQDKNDRLRFDTNGDGNYNDIVRLAETEADAFSPGFCSGVARSSTRGVGGCRQDRDGAEYGARIGYDRRMGNFVVGGLIEGARSEAKDAVSGYSTTPASYSIQREIDWSASARLRAGYTPNGGALFYATGGASFARINHDFSTTNGVNSFTERRDKKGVWGWQAGGGAELMVTNNMTVGLEYLYNRYNDNKYSVLVGPGTALPTNPFIRDTAGATAIKASDNKFDYHSLRATIGFQF